MEQFLLWVCLAFVVAVLALIASQDWQHLSRPSRRATGIVTGHRSRRDDGSKSYAAVISFTSADGRAHQIEDQLLTPLPRPALGTTVALRYPEGLPHQARVPRPWLRAGLYGLLLLLAAMLAGRLLGWLSAGGDIAGL